MSWGGWGNIDGNFPEPEETTPEPKSTPKEVDPFKSCNRCTEFLSASANFCSKCGSNDLTLYR